MRTIALLESQKEAGSTGGGSAASIALHVVVLAFAVAMTSSPDARIERHGPVYIPLPQWHTEEKSNAEPTRAPIHLQHVPAISIRVPTVIPPPISSIGTAPDLLTAIGTSLPVVPGAAPGSGAAPAVDRGETPFGFDEVDVPASVLPGQHGPSYPDELRALAVEGRVIAQFIVGENGRVESDPAIVSASDDRFALAVKRYLASARYRPATKNGHAVRQLVRQEFDFTMAR